MRKKTAYDFDGVLNKLPTPFAMFMRYTSPTDIFERAKLRFLKTYIIILIIARLPLILDNKVFQKINWKDTNYVISGRVIRSKEISIKLKKFKFEGIYMRNTVSVPELTFKIRICRKLRITEYIEDRLYVIKRLKANGINAKDVRKWKK